MSPGLKILEPSQFFPTDLGTCICWLSPARYQFSGTETQLRPVSPKNEILEDSPGQFIDLSSLSHGCSAATPRQLTPPESAPQNSLEELVRLFCWLLGRVKTSEPCKGNTYALKYGRTHSRAPFSERRCPSDIRRACIADPSTWGKSKITMPCPPVLLCPSAAFPDLLERHMVLVFMIQLFCGRARTCAIYWKPLGDYQNLIGKVWHFLIFTSNPCCQMICLLFL